MTDESQASGSSEVKSECAGARQRRVADEMRLRELELYTNFQINTLSESLNTLRNDFNLWRDSLNDRLVKVDAEMGGMKTRLTIIITLIGAQTLGLVGASGISKFIGM
jgi:hypothetical protein